MKRIARSLALGMLVLPRLLVAVPEPWFQTDFPPEEFRGRWEKVFYKIGGKAVAVVAGLPQGDGFQYPRQSNEFYYLCGVETPGSYLLLDGRTRKVTLYLPPRNARTEAAEGKILSADDAELAKRLTGADDVASTEVMRDDWLRKLPGSLPESLFTPFSPASGAGQGRYELLASHGAIAADPWDGRLPREAHFIELVKARYPRVQVKDATPIFDELRAVKSSREVALIRRASQIAGMGILEAMKTTRPGLFEYHLDAAARYVFLVNGCRLEGYRSIIASGNANIFNMHYFRNNSELKAGDWLLMDFAPDYRSYTSDIARMWPVSGKFAPWQRELLGFVLTYRYTILARIRPGVTAKDIMAEAKTAMEPVFEKTHFSKPAYEQAARKLVESGGGVFSHPVGMVVHDDGEYVDKPLQPGVVFSIDPQLRVPEENLYVRYEDVVVVTASGVENFTDFLPSALEDIERSVRGDGILQKFPPQPARP